MTPTQTAAAHAAGRHRARRDSAGFTLVEFTMAMGIFMFVIAVSLSGVAYMSRDVVKTTNLSTSTDQIRQAFTRLDREVRYASEINTPALKGSIWYLEFQGLNSTGVDTCFQWRVDTTTDKLQTRRWAASTTTIPTTWSTVASNVANDTTSAQAPFTFTAADNQFKFQVLDVMLIGKRGTSNTSALTLSTSMTARNSSVGSTTNNDSDGDGVLNTTCHDSTGTVNRP